MSQTYNLGKVAITPRGAYSSTAQYTPLDILSHNGSSYLVLQNCMGVTPPNATYYMVAASKGDTGSAGASPTIAAGTVTMTPAGTSASVTNVGTNVNASFNFTLPSGNMIYTGTGVTGTSTTPTVFSGSGVTNAGVGDIYFNTSTVAFYQCTLGGAASVAKWKFLTYSVTDSSITTSKIADSAVTTNKIADGAVTEAKLDSDLNASLARVDGVYEQMTVGNAEQIVSTVGITDETPYNFRTSGGSLDIGDREELNAVVGATVAWNQICDNDFVNHYAKTGSPTVTKSGDTTTITVGNENSLIYLNSAYRSLFAQSGHKLLVFFNGYDATNKGSSNVKFSVLRSSSTGNTSDFAFTSDAFMIANTSNIYGFGLYITNNTSGNSISFKGVSVINLTTMFGSTIADYIYALEQSNAGAGVAYFRKLFQKPYYAYNSGELLSVKTSAHKMVGFNQWDEEWELGGLVGATGQPFNAADRIRSKNFCKCVPSTVYYCKAPSVYTTIWWYDASKGFIKWESAQDATNQKTVISPSNAAYFKLVIAGNTTTYGNNLCLNISWDGERNGEYEPYQQWNYPLDSSLTVRGILKLDANNNLYADGDRYMPSGEVQRRYKEETFDGSNDESWTLNTTSEGNAIFQITISDSVSIVNDNNDLRTRCDKLTAYPAYPLTRSGRPTYACGLVSSNRLFVILPSASVADVTALRTWLGTNNLKVVYELATPTTETADPYTQTQIVDDFGTEEFVDAAVEANERDVAIPVGNETVYKPNLRAKLEMAPDSPDGGDGDYIVRQTNGQNSYIPLVEVKELPDFPSNDGSYKLRCTVTDGTATLSWVSDS